MTEITNRLLAASAGFFAFSFASCFTFQPASADAFSFSTGTPDGLIGTLSRPTTGSLIQTETADDFTLSQGTALNQATFFGLIPAGTQQHHPSRNRVLPSVSRGLYTSAIGQRAHACRLPGGC